MARIPSVPFSGAIEIVSGATSSRRPLAASDLGLGDDATKRLDRVSALDVVSAPKPNDYPYGPFGVKQSDRYVNSARRPSAGSSRAAT